MNGNIRKANAQDYQQVERLMQKFIFCMQTGDLIFTSTALWYYPKNGFLNISKMKKL